jgi:hypothetical protein
MVLIKTFSDGSELTFDEGAFDQWCVYLKRPGQTRYAPKDVEYFGRLVKLGQLYGAQKVYDDFVAIYNQTTATIETPVLENMEKIAGSYPSYHLEIEILFAILYAGMVAEENKQNAILKKRIKRLGMYQILMEKLEPETAANFSKEKKWKELDRICCERGF